MKICRLYPLTATILVLISMVGYRFNLVFSRWIHAFGLGLEISMFHRRGLPALIMSPFLLK